MRALDLFCGAGGAAQGYHQAGFEVVGVDLAPQPRYPFEFHQLDAMSVLRGRGSGWRREQRFFTLNDFDLIHTSPPCQSYSVTASLHTNSYPALIGEVRSLLRSVGVPWVIENVEGARPEMRNPVRLCGSSFGLGVRRHRLFELSWPVGLVPPCAHHLQPEPVDVTGTGGPCATRATGGGGLHRKPRNLTHAREAMGIDWMTRPELSEAVPPAFTAWVGSELLAHLAIAA